MIVDFTDAARDDLRAIGEWIACNDPGRAAGFVQELLDQALALGEGAELYPVIDQHLSPPVHRKNHRRYRIFYSIEEEVVTILHVHHGRRGSPDWP